MIKNLLFIVSFFLSINTFSANIYVDRSAPAGGDGLTWGTAFNDIQSAVDAASANDVIFIAEGIYRPQAEIDITIPLTIRGGYPQGGGTQNIAANAVQIQADFDPSNLLFRVFEIHPNSDSTIEGIRFFQTSRSIYTDSNLEINSVQFEQTINNAIYISGDIINLEINNSLFSNSADTHIYNANKVVDNLTVNNCIFQNGSASIVSLSDDVVNFTINNSTIRNFTINERILILSAQNNTISNTLVENNTLNNNPIIGVYDANLTIQNSDFINNIGESAICFRVNNGNVILERSNFSNNTANGSFAAGVFRMTNSALSAVDCHFKNNDAQGSQPDGIGSANGATTVLSFDNCEFINNTADGSIAYGLFKLFTGVSLTITNSIIDGNEGGNGSAINMFTLGEMILENNIFRNHTNGGPVVDTYNSASGNVTLNNNIFENNTVTAVNIGQTASYTSNGNIFNSPNASVILNGVPNASLSNDYFRGNANSSEFLYLNGTDVDITNTIMISEVANGTHDVIRLGNNVSQDILNSTFTSTNINDTHVRIRFDNGQPSTFENSILWSGSNLSQSALTGSTVDLTIRHSLVKGENPTGAGNLDGTVNANRPRFVNPSNYDFRALQCSPTVNAGNNSYTSETIDLLSNPRVFETTIDMGAYELQEAANATCIAASLPLCSDIISPNNGATNVEVNTAISWLAASDAIGYTLQIGTTSGGSEILSETLGNVLSYNLPSDLPANTEIFVNLIPFNGEGNAVGCTIESFTTITEAIIPILTCSNLSVPSDGNINQPVNTDISWTAVSGALGYRLNVGTTSGGTDILNNFDVGSDLIYDFPENLPENTEIFVTITPHYEAIEATGCSEESFTTGSAATIPNCTNLTVPTNGSTGVAVGTDINWSSVSDADGYLLTVGTTSGGDDILTETAITTTTYNFPADLPQGTEVFVTIVPYNSAGNASSCGEESFTIEIVPECTNLIAPLNGATDVSIATNIEWNAIANADGYFVTVGTTSGGNDILSGIDIDAPATSYDFPSDLPENTEVFVTIIPWNSTGNSTGCSEESFTTEIITTTNPFITTWETTTPNETITIPTRTPTYTYNYTIDWGDGSIDTNVAGDITHTYTTPGIHTISISGVFPQIHFNGIAVDRDKILTIEQWGDIEWSSLNQAFKGCSNLNITNPSIDIPNLSNVTNMSEAFRDATTFNGDITAWDVGTITNMFRLFNGAENFNQNIGNWNVSNVVNMTRMFERARIFNQDIGNWNTSNVTSMAIMFAITDDFNQDIGNWDTSNVTSMNTMFGSTGSFNQDIGNWDVGNVTNFTQMFISANAFNQDIGNWDVSQATETRYMFQGADSFDQNLGNWNVGNLTSANGMFNGITLSTTNYEALLIGWNTQNLQSNVTFSGGFSTYCSQEAQDARANMIASDGWTVTDGGLSVSPTFDVIANANVADTYTLPVITGTDLTGNELYYTGANGTGTSYTAGGFIAYADFPSYPITLYVYDSTSCNPVEISFELTITESLVPNCTNLSSPINGATNVSIATDLTWNAIANADGYFISVGTTSGGNDILNAEDVTNSTFNLPINLPENTEIFVTIIPYNSVGNATGCVEESFITETIATIPNCTNLSSPLNGATNVSIATDLTWNAIAYADGYFVYVGTTSGGNDILNAEDVTNSTFNLPINLPENTEIFVTIMPYNFVGNATGCVEESFTTGFNVEIPETDNTKYGFSPNGDGINEYWEIDNIENYPNNEVVVYNRWGDIVFRVKGYNNSDKAFRGNANQKTNMGAGKLPSGTYFFNIRIDGSHNLKKTKGFVIIKR